jgi:7-cyano-7-deazaguanine synthase
MNAKAQNKAIVLLSGGLDSCVTAAIAKEHYDICLLHVNYGQKTEQREKKAFNEIADYYRVQERLCADIDYLKQIKGSSLTDESLPIPEVPSPPDEIPSTYVPFRNAHLLAIAVSWGEKIGAKKIFIGAMEEDSSGYPDCKEEFFKAFNRVIEIGTKSDTHISIKTPIIHKTKVEVVKIGDQLNAPLHLTWSCYKEDEKACGLCESCRLRIKAFKKAGLKDPIPYNLPIDWESKDK